MRYADDDTIDVKPKGDVTSMKEVLSFTADVARDSVQGVFLGVASTAGDFGSGCHRVITGDYKGAATIVERRMKNVIKGTIGTLKSTAEIIGNSYQSIANDEEFLTRENKVHLARICQASIFSILGHTALVETDPNGGYCQLEGDACSLPGVENGVFVGDKNDLNVLIKQGEIEDSTHIQPSEISRSAAARNAFLEAHGIEDLNGAQVHHVVPLSEGGADDPANMVVIDADDHAKITAAHAEFYKW